MYVIARLIRLVIIIIVIYILYRVLWKGDWFPSLFGNKEKEDRNQPPSSLPVEEMKRDPVCGTFLPEKQAIKLKKRGQTHYFCSEQCKKKFVETPRQ